MSKQVIYCWDTSVFLAWLGEEKSAPLGDIDLIIGEIDRGEAILLVPVTAYSEILDAKHTPEQMAKLEKFLSRSNVVIADTTKPIARKVGEIRGQGLKEDPPLKLKTPDTTFIATAIHFEANVLHTLEEKMRKLDESPIVDGLKIKLPKRSHRCQCDIRGSPAVRGRES